MFFYLVIIMKIFGRSLEDYSESPKELKEPKEERPKKGGNSVNEFIEDGIMYRIEDGQKLVICMNTKCGEHQIPDNSCWIYSGPTPNAGEEKHCPGYVLPKEEDLEEPASS